MKQISGSCVIRLAALLGAQAIVWTGSQCYPVQATDYRSPSLTNEAEPENVLNTASPGRSLSWTLPNELTTPARPTTGGVQSPNGPLVAYGPSPVTQQYRPRHDLSVPRVQWGAREQCEEE